MSRVCRLLLSFVLIAFAGTAAAETVPPAAAPATALPVPEALLSRFHGSVTVEQYLGIVRTEFRQLDADGNGELSLDDIAIFEAVVLASARAAQVQRIMSAD